nr:MFS transporter [Clostridia bacterium]
MSFNQKHVAHNKIRAIIAYAFRTAALLCANGSLMQTFLSTVGFSEQHIYIHASLYQAINVITILVCARFADSRSIIKRSAIVQIPCALLFLLYMPLCLINNVSSMAYVWLLAVAVFQSITFALHAICEYKLPYYVYKIEEYGMVMSICGVLSSVVSFAVGALVSLLSVSFSYNIIMLIAFGISFMFILASGILQYFQKSLIADSDASENSEKSEKQQKIPLITMFRHKAFTTLFVGNITRGFANGTTTVLAAAALSIGYDETLTSAMVSVQSAAMLAACGLYAIVASRIHPRFFILSGSICFISLPVLLVREQPLLFLAMYGILMFGRTLVDYAVPSALLYAVPVEIAGTYNAWRLVLHNGGTMLATVIAGFIPLNVLIWISLAFQLISGLNFFTAKIMHSQSEKKP